MATEHDKDILNHIFNPLLPTGEMAFDDSATLDAQNDENGNSEIFKLSKAFELEGVKAAEEEDCGGDYAKAIELFTKAIEVAPSRPSPYNNRAQTYRLVGNITAAKVDLNNAINLSSGKGRAATQAYCQRGLIHLKENEMEEAKRDFESAAKLGSQFAKAQLVQMNPYAALCNKMLREVMEKFTREGDSDMHEHNTSEKS